MTVKPAGAPSGHVDGGWWPRSRDAAAELPALLAALAGRMGTVERVSYHLADWDPAPSKIVVGAALVRMAGFHSQRAGTVDLIGATGRLTLLVVPPGTADDVAQRALASAGREGDTASAAELLAP